MSESSDTRSSATKLILSKIEVAILNTRHRGYKDRHLLQWSDNGETYYEILIKWMGDKRLEAFQSCWEATDPMDRSCK